MPTTIPLTTDPSQTFQVDLEGTVFTFRVIFNTRKQMWTMDIADADGVELVSGIPLLLGANMVNQFNLDIGALVMVEDGDTGLDAGPDDLGTRVLLANVTQKELDNEQAV